MGRLLREFSMTLVFTIVISTVVSLTVTPMICAWLPHRKEARKTRLDRWVEGALDGVLHFYARTLRPVVDHPWITLVVILGTIAWTVQLYRTIPKGNLPQDDIGLINGTTEASPDVSFTEMTRLQRRVSDTLLADPDVLNVGSFIGAGSLTASGNQGRLFVMLKPIGERKASSKEVIDRLRKEFAKIAGVNVFMVPSQDLRSGGRVEQVAISVHALRRLARGAGGVARKNRRRHEEAAELVDVTSDKEAGGLRASVVIDRNAASRMNVPIAAINTALNSAFGQRQDTIIYTQRNQYRVVFETPPARQRDVRDLAGIYVSSSTGMQIPLTSLARIERSSMPLVVNHQGVLAAVTISYNIAPGSSLDAATTAIEALIAELNPPSSLHAGFAGDAADFRKVARGMATAHRRRAARRLHHSRHSL